MLKYVKVEPRKNCNLLILSKGDIDTTQKSIASAASEKSKTSRGQYNSYSKEQHAMIGKYAAVYGPTCAAKHYTVVWGIQINELNLVVQESMRCMCTRRSWSSTSEDSYVDDLPEFI